MSDTQTTVSENGHGAGQAQEHTVHVTTRLLQPGSEQYRFRLPDDSALLDLMAEGAQRAGATLLPDSDHPLDHLHNILHHDELGPVISDLDQALGAFVKQKDTTHDFGIELVLAFRVNTRWAVAPTPELTPHQILDLSEISLNYQDYTLYLPDSTTPLPLETPIAIERGMVFEAQKDGKYGEGDQCVKSIGE